MLAFGGRDGGLRIFGLGLGLLNLPPALSQGFRSSPSWSAQGRRLAWAGTAGVQIWDARFANRPARSFYDACEITDLAWSPESRTLALATVGHGIRLWHVDRGESYAGSLDGHIGAVNGVAWHPHERILASAGHDATIKIWDADSGAILQTLDGHVGGVLALRFALDGRTLASAAADTTIRLWDVDSGRHLGSLEGHTAPVCDLGFTPEGQFLATRSIDGVLRLWRREGRDHRWVTVAQLEQGASADGGKLTISPVRQLPEMAVLAAVDEERGALQIWEMDLSVLRDAPSLYDSVHYRNAKVVLVGQSSAGKSGLSLVLTNQEFKPTDSSNGRAIGLFGGKPEEEEAIGNRRVVTREIWLWDLAGQPGFQMIHQLSLNEVSVAIVVFTDREKESPLSGVYHWAHSLRVVAERHNANLPMRRFLVLGRCDVGRPNLSEESIQKVCQELGFDQYIATSAKTGEGIDKLRGAIQRAIDWERLPYISSSDLFQSIKDFLQVYKASGRVVATEDELFQAFLGAGRPPRLKDLREQFATGVLLADSRGLIRRLSFGRLVLLKPELLDAYAAAVVTAAQEEDPLGLGSIAESDAQAGRFKIPSEHRLEFQDQERLLLIAMIEDVVRYDLAIREDGRLIFPSALKKDPNDWVWERGEQGDAVELSFKGPVALIYNTLVVRLSRSGVFSGTKLWKNAIVTRDSTSNGICGIRLDESRGVGKLTLFFDQVTRQSAFLFEEFIRNHLEQRALPGSVQRERIFRCPACCVRVNVEIVRKRRAKNHVKMECPACQDAEISLLEPIEELREAMERAKALINEAEKQRQQATAEIAAIGDQQTRKLRLFCGYAREDARFAEKLIRHLKALELGGLVTIESEQNIGPGQKRDEALARQIGEADVILLLISADFHADCADLMTRALRRAAVARIIPVLTRAGEWETAWGHLQPLPLDRRPVASWEDEDEAWASIVNSLKQVAEDFLATRRGRIMTQGT